MTQDNHKQFTFAYNYLNLPATMTKGANVITMTYTADGEKLAKHKPNAKMKTPTINILLTILFASCQGSDDVVELGDAYFLRIEGTGTNEIMSRMANVNGVPPDILEVYSDDTIIIAKQRPSLPFDAMHEKIHYEKGTNVDYYWIIDKKSKKRTGPFIQDSFLHTGLNGASYQLKSIKSMVSD